MNICSRSPELHFFKIALTFRSQVLQNLSSEHLVPRGSQWESLWSKEESGVSSWHGDSFCINRQNDFYQEKHFSVEFYRILLNSNLVSLSKITVMEGFGWEGI